MRISTSRYDGENYTRINNSKYSHRSTLGLGFLEGKAITTGCSRGSWIKDECDVKTEILDITTMTWSDADDYPYVSKEAKFK